MKNFEYMTSHDLSHDWLASGANRKRSCEEHMLEVQRSQCQRHLRSVSRLGQLTTWLKRCTASLFYVCLSLFLYLHYISPHYSRNCNKNNESFKEKTLEIHLRVRDCIPTILYTFLWVFLILFPLQFHILWEVLCPNTNHTHSECYELLWSFWEALGYAILWWMQLMIIVGSGKLVKTRLGEARW